MKNKMIRCFDLPGSLGLFLSLAFVFVFVFTYSFGLGFRIILTF